MNKLGIRSRVTIWYVGILALILSAYLVGVSLLLFWRMTDVLRRIAEEDLETVKGLLYFQPDGTVGVREDYHHHTDWKQVQERLLELLSPDGRILYRNEQLGNRDLGGAPFSGEGTGGYSGRSEKLADGTRVVLISRAYELNGNPILIRVGYRWALIWSELWQTLLILAGVMPLVLGVTAYAGNRMVKRALDPIARIARRAEEINSERLNERLPEGDAKDELGDLARIFNAMLARIEQSFEQLKRFTADASHELRTPLAAMRSIGEVELQSSGTVDQYRDAIGSMLEEVNRLTEIVECLLVLSRADAGQIQMHAENFLAADLLSKSASLLGVLLEEKKITFELQGDLDARIHGDPLYLRQATINVLHNALKFSPSGATITADIHALGPQVEMRITDSGPGISSEEASRVFERFYRSNSQRASSGTGLGLAIAKWAVEANGGSVGVMQASGDGASVYMKLPRAS